MLPTGTGPGGVGKSSRACATVDDQRSLGALRPAGDATAQGLLPEPKEGMDRSGSAPSAGLRGEPSRRLSGISSMDARDRVGGGVRQPDPADRRAGLPNRDRAGSRFGERDPGPPRARGPPRRRAPRGRLTSHRRVEPRIRALRPPCLLAPASMGAPSRAKLYATLTLSRSVWRTRIARAIFRLRACFPIARAFHAGSTVTVTWRARPFMRMSTSLGW